MKDAVNIEYDFAQFRCVPRTSTAYQNPTRSVVHHRFIGDGVVEKLAIANGSNERQVIDIKLEVAADCADLFESKGALPKKAEYYRHMRAERLVLGDRREGFVRETIFHASVAQSEIDENPSVFDEVLNVNGCNPIESLRWSNRSAGFANVQSDSEPNDAATSRCRNRKGDLRRGEKYRCEPPRP